jgi:hypothetical protein
MMMAAQYHSLLFARKGRAPSEPLREIRMAIQCAPPTSIDRVARPARAETPSLFRRAAHRTTPVKQLDAAITAIMNPRISRPRLRQLAGIASAGS